MARGMRIHIANIITGIILGSGWNNANVSHLWKQIAIGYVPYSEMPEVKPEELLSLLVLFDMNLFRIMLALVFHCG
jgi:hypothetical protein